MTPHTLTPTDIITLRTSIRQRTSDGTHGSLPAFVVWSPSDETFILHHYGQAMCAHPDITVLAACMVAERAETGFIRRILDATDPPDVATLDPSARTKWTRDRAADAARIKELLAASEAERSRRASLFAQPNPSTLSLDDLESL